MIKYIKFLMVGVFFGIIAAKSEFLSWYRIYEMFKFKSFHMYGLIGTAIVVGLIAVWVFKKFNIRTTEREPMVLMPKQSTYFRYIFGGIIFGLGWAMTGACPGPTFVLIGAGFPTLIITLASALLGTFVYGLIKDKLPH